MAIQFQLVINCADPEPLARFWAAALGYELEPPPDGFATWDDRRRDIGLPEDMLGVGTDSIIDTEEGRDHYAVAMKDPEGNEFDIN